MNDMIKSKTARDQLVNHNEILDQTKPLSMLPGIEVVTNRQLEEYFGVNSTTIKKVYNRYKAEFDGDGSRFVKSSEFTGIGLPQIKSNKRGYTTFKLEDGTLLEINNSGMRCFSRQAVLRLAMLLPGSETAEEIRTQLEAIIPENSNENVTEITETPTKNVTAADNPIKELFKTFFYKEDFPVRIVIKDGEPWFVASDICKVLELGTTSKAIERLDEDEKDMNSIPTLGGTQNMSIISEPGLYSLVLGSRKPEAKEFKRWITHDVIPTLRNTGGYVLDPEHLVEYYFNDLDPNLKTIMTGAFTTIKQLQTENAALTKTNQDLEQVVKLLADGINTWDNRAMLNAMIRAASSRYNDDFKRAWNTYYKRLAYKEGIALKQRAGDGKLIERIQPDEWMPALKTAAAWLIELHINVEYVINTTNAALIQC